MTKYSPEFKAQVVVEYMTDGLSSYTLEKKYKVSARQIRKWIQQYQLQGIKCLHKHHRNRNLHSKFKWSG
ncbi:transposase, partial [Ligilactobacillus agilis]|uniref:transposase n=1 Tax=Ligilactobacillus agilis TaxID=1601 RepID=UPI00117A266C